MKFLNADVRKHRSDFRSISITIPVAMGMSLALAVFSANEINEFERIPIRSHRLEVHDKTIEGRTCSLCQKLRSWDQFSLKPKGLNGRDSRCRPCIARIRRDVRIANRQARKKSIKEINDGVFKSVIFGQDTSESATEFGQIFAHGICDLLAKGELK